MDDRIRKFEEEQKYAARQRAQYGDDSECEVAAEGNSTRPPTLRDRLITTQMELERRLHNIKRLRGALSQDALDLPASILD